MNFKKPFVTIGRKTILLTKTIGIGILILIIFAPGFLKIQELKNRNKDLIQKTRRLEAENSILKSELQRVDKDQIYREKILREKMGVVRKNEMPVKIVPQE